MRVWSLIHRAYILTFARRDRRLGAQIVPTRADCTGNAPISEDDVRAKLLNGWPLCGMTTVVSTVDAADAMKRRVRRSAVTMDDFARELQTNVDRPVVDRTGLEGRFDIEYTFVTSHRGRNSQPADSARRARRTAGAEAGGAAYGRAGGRHRFD